MQAHPAFNAAIDEEPRALLMQRNFIRASYSPNTDINKLRPRTWLRFETDDREVEPAPYWSLAEGAERGVANPQIGPTPTRSASRDHNLAMSSVMPS